MSRSTLNALLRRLDQEIVAPHHLDSEDVELLRQVANRIEAVVHEHELAKSLGGNYRTGLNEALAGVEDDYPRLARFLRLLERYQVRSGQSSMDQ